MRRQVDFVYKAVGLRVDQSGIKLYTDWNFTTITIELQ